MKRTTELVAEPGERVPINTASPVEDWFELTYAQYLTVPRSLLISMPLEWQERFKALFDEFDDTFDWLPKEGRYWCRLKDGSGRFVEDPLMQYRHPDYRYIDSIRKPQSVGE